MLTKMHHTQEHEELLKELLPMKKSRPKVMIVDDNMELLEELQEILSHSGYDVEIVNDSDRALAMAYQTKPEILLLDLKMGPKNGFQVADEFRHTFATKDLPIIAMTGFYTEKEHVLMMKLCGISVFILKPFNPLDLVAKIEFALGRRREEYFDRDIS